MKIGVLLSGCGVYDGAEIHESVFTLLALDQLGVSTLCMAPDMPQHHVINHLDGSELNEQRNVLIEAARIARGEIQALSTVTVDQIDGLVMPGGFGAAKNLTKWAFSGPDGAIQAEVKHLLLALVQAKKPIAALCMSPAVVAKALQDSGLSVELTVGTTDQASPYDIQAISAGLEATGAKAVMKPVEELVIDKTHRIISTPCYMMNASIAQVHIGIEKACQALVNLVKEGT